MIDLDNRDFSWDLKFRPKDFGTLTPESFEFWWQRNKESLIHLDPRICEQWVYKHWDCSYYGFLPLEKLTWTLETWNTEKIIESVGIWDEGLISEENHSYCKPVYDYKVISNHKYEPSKTMDKSDTWNLPIVILNSAKGFIIQEQEKPHIKYWLIEGHKRIRYLNALYVLKNLRNNHDVFIIKLNDNA